MMRRQQESAAAAKRADRWGWIGGILLGLISAAGSGGAAAEPLPQPQSGPSADSASRFTVGVAQRDITPGKPMPMWGYGARHDRLSEGVLDPLRVKALVIEAASAKLAIVGLDLGRGPTPVMMDRIRTAVAPRGIAQVLICGSHTHHGPVIELTDQPGFGKGKFDDAVAYARELPDRIIAAIIEADWKRQPARIGVAFRDLGLNRNRQTKRPERPTDPRLTAIRFDAQTESRSPSWSITRPTRFSPPARCSSSPRTIRATFRRRSKRR